MRTGLVLTVIGLGLSGCATAAPTVVLLPTDWAGSRTSFSLKPVDEGELAPAEAVVRDQLLAQGWREAGEVADWRVQVAYDARPTTYGLFSDEGARAGHWLEAPRRVFFLGRSSTRYSLQLVLEPTKGGGGTYVSRSSLVAPKDQGARQLEALAAAAVAPLSPRR